MQYLIEVPRLWPVVEGVSPVANFDSEGLSDVSGCPAPNEILSSILGDFRGSHLDRIQRLRALVTPPVRFALASASSFRISV